MSSSTPYSARVRITELLERGKSQITDLEIYRDGSQVIPTAATYSIMKPDNQYIVEGGVCTISDAGTVKYTHTITQLNNNLDLGEGYVQEFSCTINSEVFVFRRMAAIVRKRLYPVISDADLEEVYTDLGNLRPSSITSYQGYIDSAWYTIIRRIRTIGAGYEYLITSPEAFSEAHRHLSLYLIFRDFHSGMSQSAGSRYLELAQEHYRLYNDEFHVINFIYDEDHTGKPEEANKRKASQPSIYLNRPGPYMYRRRRSRW